MPDLAHVVVDDQKLNPGHIIHNPRELAVVKLRGAVVLPVDADLAPPLASAALDGFFIKHWGQGWIANKGAGERCCPMVLRVHPQRTLIHYAFRCRPGQGGHATDVVGRIRLVGDSGQAGYLSAGLAHSRNPDLIESTPLDEHGGWTLTGVSTINVVNEGLLALSLYAVARNLRILWSAVSLTSHRVE